MLDLTRLLPGAFCTLALADLGADVVKVEAPPGGDPLRSMPPGRRAPSPLFEALNRNKRSLLLDLKGRAGKDALLRLVAGADALVEGNRPGVMERLGVGWDRLREANPHLVMCSITGYGSGGPMAGRAGHDINYMALSGALSLTGPPGGAPLPLGLQAADLGAGGMAAACAILAAVLDVSRGGPGRHLEVSMTDGAAAWTLPEAAMAAASGTRPQRSRGLLTGLFPCYRVYACEDGFLSVGALEPGFWANLCQALGRPDLQPLQFAEGRDGDRAHADLEEIFAGRSRAAWESALAGLDVCVEPVLELDEVSSHPHWLARTHPGAGLGPGVPVRPAVPVAEGWNPRPAPRLGEHTAEVLAEAGLDGDAIAAMRRRGGV